MLTAEQLAERARREAEAGAYVVSGATSVGAGGELSPSDQAAAAVRGDVRIVVVLHGITAPDGGRIVPECSAAIPGVRAQRILCELGVIDVTADGLIVREVAPGVSAADLQRTTDVVLLAGPDLRPVDP